jgi:peptidoglycan/xylan/chitin deacetylase (PgdA/CDA1 family)
LDLLKLYNAKATFFCIGRNAIDHPEIFQRVIAEGHTVGNHSYNHLNGWKTENKTYFENIDQCQEIVQSKLFRPPYGRIKRSQINFLKQKYKIIMWDVLSWDFNQELSAQQCTNYVLKNIKPGSIVVFHDSLKAQERMFPALEATLKKYSEEGWRFEGLN